MRGIPLILTSYYMHRSGHVEAVVGSKHVGAFARSPFLVTDIIRLYCKYLHIPVFFLLHLDS